MCINVLNCAHREGNMKIEDTRVVPVRIPIEIHEWLKSVAKGERRTINQQIVYVCERAKKEEEAPCK